MAKIKCAGFGGEFEVEESTIVNDADKLKMLKNESVADAERSSKQAAEARVDVDGVSWNGGMFAVNSITSAVIIAENLGQSVLTLWDADNINHDGVTLAEARTIAAEIWLQYVYIKLNRNNKIKNIEKAKDKAGIEAAAAYVSE